MTYIYQAQIGVLLQTTPSEFEKIYYLTIYSSVNAGKKNKQLKIYWYICLANLF